MFIPAEYVAASFSRKSWPLHASCPISSGDTKTRRLGILMVAEATGPLSRDIRIRTAVAVPGPLTQATQIETVPRRSLEAAFDHQPFSKQRIQETEDVDAYWDYQLLFRSQREENLDPLQLDVVEGYLPTGLHGCYYLCGPGILTDDYGSSVHPLDGHGYLRKFEISSGSVKYSARFVDTEARKEEYDPETKSWHFTYRGPFSMLRGGDRFGNFKVMKNVANTSVLKWAGRLMCLWEGGEPYEMSPSSLSTIGISRVARHKEVQKQGLDSVDLRFQFPWTRYISNKAATEKNCDKSDFRSLMTRESVLKALSSAIFAVTTKMLSPILSGLFSMPGERMLSHLKVDIKRQLLVAITCHSEDMLLPKSTFTAYEFDTTMNLISRREFIIHEHQMIHDWGLTDNYYLLVGNRIKLDYLGSVAALAGMSPMISALELDNSLPYTPLYLLPRFSNLEERGQRDWSKPLKLPEQFWLLHVGNAYETSDEGKISVFLQASVCSYEWFSFKHMFGYDWQQKRLNPTFMNKSKTSSTSAGELGVPHMVEISATVATQKDEPQVSAQVRRLQSWSKACDFPAINPKARGSRNAYTYVAASSGLRKSLEHFPFDVIVKLNNEEGTSSMWWAGKRCFVGEPMFVPRKASLRDDSEEDDGYILFVQYAVAEELCYLVILDAKKIGRRDDVIAKIRIPKQLTFPMGFHGFWEDQSQQDDHPWTDSVAT